MSDMSVTCETSQVCMNMSKELACMNMPDMSVTCETSHWLSDQLKR